MDRLSPGDPTQRIVFMKAAQVGATEAGNNWIGFAIHQAPGPMLAVQPTVELAKRNSRQRIDPLIDESPELRERVKPARSRDAGNTMLSKEFAGGILIMTGANSAVGLRSTPARYIFLDEVDAYPRTFMLFCRQVLATDFKAMHRVQLGEAPQLLEVGESGEFKRGTLGESKESYKVKTYGRVVAITRQTLINDDLDAFTRIPAMYGNSIAQLESDVVWGIITANPAMADGNALFHTTHKNLAGTGTALAVDAVGAARAAMAKQTGLDKKTVLNVRPAFLIVPASLELKAEQLVAQNLVPAATSSVVPQSIRTLAPISEPRLDAASETAWYLAASPNQIDTIEYAYLEGQQGAYIETRNGFDVDGVEIKCRLDFGAKAIDWRGLYKNPGA